jgi:hypothetical protein
LFDPLFDPGASSAIVNTSLVTFPWAWFLVGAHSAITSMHANTTAKQYVVFMVQFYDDYYNRLRTYFPLLVN